MKKKPSVAKLHKKLWPIFSQYIRLRDTNNQGCVYCITCPAYKPWKEMQAGHFVSRRFKATLYDEMNVHPQCIMCNVFLHGNLLIYRRKMDEIYGADKVLELEQRSKQIKKFTTFELEEMIQAYTERLEQLQ